MEIIDLGPLNDEERAQLEGDEVDPFDGAGMTLQYRAKDRHVVLREDGRLVASAGLTEAEVEVAGQRFRVVGLGGVIVTPTVAAGCGRHSASTAVRMSARR